jgi:hypothetical protein
MGQDKKKKEIVTGQWLGGPPQRLSAQTGQ